MIYLGSAALLIPGSALLRAYVFGSGENDDFFPLAMDVLSPEDTPPGNDGAGPYRQPFDQLNPDGKFVMTFDVQLMDPVLATMQDGGELRLNMGPYAVDRVNGDTTDGNENFTVRYVSMEADGSETISVSAFGYTQTYSGVRKIYAEGGFGVDTLVLAGTPPGPPTYTPDNTGLPGNGTLNLGGSKLTFTGLEFVRPVPPRITSLHLDSNVIGEGGAVTLSGTFLDPGSRETHVAKIDWDDGTPPDTINLGAGVLSFSSGPHRFPDVALGGVSHVVTAWLTDQDGSTASASTSVMVNSVPPTATLANSGPVNEGSPGNRHLFQPVRSVAGRHRRRVPVQLRLRQRRRLRDHRQPLGDGRRAGLLSRRRPGQPYHPAPSSRTRMATPPPTRPQSSSTACRRRSTWAPMPRLLRGTASRGPGPSATPAPTPGQRRSTMEMAWAASPWP